MNRKTKKSEPATPPPPLEITLVRHGQAGGEQRPGEVGSPLTRLGLRQADRVGKRLSAEEYDHIYSSDMARAFETAQAVIQHHPRTRFTVSKNIREIAGFHFSARASRKKDERERVARETEAYKRFLRRLRKHGPGERILLVIHGNLIRMLISVLAGVNPRKTIALMTNNTGVFKVQLFLDDGRQLVNLTNCVKHLAPSQVS